MNHDDQTGSESTHAELNRLLSNIEKEVVMAHLSHSELMMMIGYLLERHPESVALALKAAMNFRVDEGM